MTGLPGGAFFVGVRGLAGAWRVLDGFLAGSWRVLGGRKYAPENGFRGAEGFGFRKGWEGLAFERGGRVLAFAGWEGFGFRKGWGRLDARVWLGLGMLGAGHAWGWMLRRLGLGVACYLSFFRLVLYAKPTTFAIVKTKATPPRGACYGINTNTHNHY